MMQPAPQRSSDIGTTNAVAKPVVLVVDDEPLNRFLISEALANDRYHIVEAESGEAAVAYLTDHNVDLILLDIDMPGIGGLAACRAIRALPRGRLVPITMVTGLDDNASIERAFDSGATDFLTKPVNWTLMRQRVRFMLRHGNITHELKRNEQILEHVHEIAEIGHWQWDVVNKIAQYSQQYRRLLPGVPAQVTGVTLDLVPTSEHGRFLLDELRKILAAGQTAFRIECSAEVPERGKRRFVYHGNVEYADGEPSFILSTVQDITQRYEDEERYGTIFDESPVGIVEADCSLLLDLMALPGCAEFDDARLLEAVAAVSGEEQHGFLLSRVNPAALRILSDDGNSAARCTLRAHILRQLLRGVLNRERQLITQQEFQQESGEHRMLVITARLPQTPHEFRRVVITINDVSDIVQREAQLRRADTIIANSSDAVAVMDKHKKFSAINPAYTRVTGYTLEKLQSMDIFTQLDPQQRERVIANMAAALQHQDYWRGDIDFVRADGSIMPALFQLNVIRNDEGEFDGCVTITTDISHIKESERRLYQLAHFDALTGLPNRLSLQERLQLELESSAADRAFALLYIDLDGFKLVNDSMGHPTGDRLLGDVAARLSGCCQPGDLLTRIGGDEFGLLMFSGASEAAIGAQADAILAALESPFIIEEREIFIGASIGACRYPQDAANADDMLRNADSAMYEAKRLGRGQLCYYSAELTTESDRRLQVESELRVAIAGDQLFLVYQPKYDAASGEMVGAEALVRWRSPRRGIVPPGDFIGIAESSGLIVPLGEWVINEACRQLAEWLREYGCAVPVAINISALHLRQQNLPQVIREAITRYGIDPKLLEVEITEDSLNSRDDTHSPLEMLNQLSELGVSIAIDDFGTGYSSLSRLKEMPISTLKIDRSFVRDIASNESDLAIISAIVGLGKTLDMAIVAEGVENEEQADQLRLLKCNIMQGFLYSRPLPPAELLQSLLAQRTKSE